MTGGSTSVIYNTRKRTSRAKYFPRVSLSPPFLSRCFFYFFFFRSSTRGRRLISFVLSSHARHIRIPFAYVASSDRRASLLLTQSLTRSEPDILIMHRETRYRLCSLHLRRSRSLVILRVTAIFFQIEYQNSIHVANRLSLFFEESLFFWILHCKMDKSLH